MGTEHYVGDWPRVPSERGHLPVLNEVFDTLARRDRMAVTGSSRGGGTVAGRVAGSMFRGIQKDWARSTTGGSPSEEYSWISRQRDHGVGEADQEDWIVRCSLGWKGSECSWIDV